MNRDATKRTSRLPDLKEGLSAPERVNCCVYALGTFFGRPTAGHEKNACKNQQSPEDLIDSKAFIQKQNRISELFGVPLFSSGPREFLLLENDINDNHLTPQKLQTKFLCDTI
jgi:hypothetical protein